MNINLYENLNTNQPLASMPPTKGEFNFELNHGPLLTT